MELLTLDWPQQLLSMPECAEEADPFTGRPLWRGLRVRMGMAFGHEAQRKPLSTGRADYFGALPNLAARVSALAAPGQILVEGSAGFGMGSAWVRSGEEGLVLLPEESAAGGTQGYGGASPQLDASGRRAASIVGEVGRTPNVEAIELDLLGFYLLKVCHSTSCQACCIILHMLVACLLIASACL